MAGASDKARFYLEQTVPELREWERRGIFAKPEIGSINTKRSEFEHILCSRGSSTPATYARYIAYELNLSALAKKRIQRLNLAKPTKGTKNSRHSGQTRILNLLERGTRKHNGDLSLWMQYLDYCKKVGANKRRQRVQTEILRLFPTRSDLWTKAAGDAEKAGSVSEARGLLRRGLRLCDDNGKKALLLEWTRLEMRWLARVEGRRHVLGLGVKEAGDAEQAEQEMRNSDHEANVITLPKEDVLSESHGVDEPSKPMIDDAAITQLLSTPVMSGAIPMAIFDAAMKEFPQDATLQHNFFDLVADFPRVPSTPTILQHVTESLASSVPGSVVSATCRCRLLLVGIPTSSVEFPGAIRHVLREIKTSMNSLPNAIARSNFAAASATWLEALRKDESAGPEIQQILTVQLRRLRAEGVGDNE
ncbi:MAG: U3 snoRNP protein [Chrysothrix sp. TS-e1954]|nr:MAG: U3 snoRNP protein [Chrysothrix sp. TS-e1954]